MIAWRAGLLLATSLLAACATQQPLLQNEAPVELASTPFHPQQDHQCGPAALATVLGATGIDVLPDELVPLVYLPKREGSLQIEMLAAPRRFDRIGYPVSGELDAIVKELDAGRPVLVLHNYGLPSLPRWHYAVVIGHDSTRQEILLRSGETRRQALSARTFMRAWDNADRWGFVLLKPGELPASPDRAAYLQAAAAFEKVAPPASAASAFDAAIRAWPEDPVGYVGRGTARYREGQWLAAAGDYRSALALEPGLVAARNNLAMALLELGCPAAAQRELDSIDGKSVSAALMAAVADTASRIATRARTPESGRCRELQSTLTG